MAKKLFQPDAPDSGNPGTVKTTLAPTDRIAVGQYGVEGNDVIEFQKMQEQLETVGYAGVSQLPAGCFTDNGDGSFTVADIKVNLFDNATNVGRAKEYDIAGATFILNDLQMNYICVSYNFGNPVLVNISESNYSQITESDIVPVVSVARTGLFLHYADCGWDELGNGLPNKIHRFFVFNLRMTKRSGLILTNKPTRYVAISGGIANLTIVQKTLLEYDSSLAGNPLFDISWNGTSWQYSTAATQWDNLQYNPAGGLATLDNNKWAFIIIYRGVEEQKHGYFVRSAAQYNSSAEALANIAIRLDMPGWVVGHALPIGALIFMKGSDTPIVRQYTTGFGLFYNIGAGDISHTEITDRDLADAHPAKAITIDTPFTPENTRVLAGDTALVAIQRLQGQINTNVESKTAAFDLLDTDSNKYLRVNVATDVNCTIPLGTTIHLPVLIAQVGNGIVTVAPGSGVVVNGSPKTGGQYKYLQIVQVDDNVFDVIGGVD